MAAEKTVVKVDLAHEMKDIMDEGETLITTKEMGDIIAAEILK